MVDFHSHILPNVDDGSSSLEMSLSMLEAEKEHGVKTVIATPHFYAVQDTPEQFLERRREAADKLRAATKDRPDLPEILLGAEVAYFRGMSSCEVLWDLRIAKTNYILVEPPLAPWDSNVFKELKELPNKQNLYPIIAHVDRYLMPFWWKKMMKQLDHMAAVLQFNASFFLGSRAKLAHKLMEEGRVHLLGSDCHDLSGRAPSLGALRQVLTEEDLSHIRDCQQMVLGEDEFL